ncbi:MAG: uroporphyrinogen-III C-methyltransferase [Planctomycetota bacterium]
MTANPPQPPKTLGRVSLIGAGPGDPDLITVAGLDRLRTADVVVFDALANPRLLDRAPADAVRIDVGKRAGFHKKTQDQINQILVDHARQGLRVARLKGGDPYLFGRGAEECAFCATHGVPCEVLPGVTAGVAAPACAGVPVTHRKVASSVTFITGHEDPSKSQTSLDYAALSALCQTGGSLCIYMGVARLRAIADRLIGHGLPSDTPAALVQWGTLPAQRSVRGAIDTLPALVQAQGLGSPAIVVVGAAAGIDEPGLRFFEERPLFGRTVLVPRARDRAAELSGLLREHGAAVLEAPAIRAEPVDDWAAADPWLTGERAADWLVFTSANGADFAAERIATLGRDARAFGRAGIAAVGKATAGALWDRLRVRADVVSQGGGAVLAQSLIEQGDVSGKRFVLLGAIEPRPELPEALRQAGADVTQAAVYRTLAAEAWPGDIAQTLRDGRVDWVVLTSGSTARHARALSGVNDADWAPVRVATIGATTSQAARDLGWPVHAQADEPSPRALVQAICSAQASSAAPR